MHKPDTTDEDATLRRRLALANGGKLARVTGVPYHVIRDYRSGRVRTLAEGARARIVAALDGEAEKKCK